MMKGSLLETSLGKKLILPKGEISFLPSEVGEDKGNISFLTSVKLSRKKTFHKYLAAINLGSSQLVLLFVLLHSGTNTFSNAILIPQSTGVHSLNIEGCDL